jgi:predicted esterase
MTALLETVERETGPSPAWALLWLHGLGADGNDFVPILPELVRRDWPAIRFVFPHAPPRPVTINGGMRMPAWYDIADADLRNRADMAGVRESVAQVEALVAREAERGVRASRTILAGFSQGGAVALAAGLAREQPLAGLVALSTYLPGLGGPDAPPPEEELVVPKSKTRRKTRETTAEATAEKRPQQRKSRAPPQVNGAQRGVPREEDYQDEWQQPARKDATPSSSSAQPQSQMIALPFSDTPIINRNKEFRKKGGAAGSRRSSLGMRGRRASSLIDNGHSALPHREVDPAEFYKYIAAEGLSEPRRMKQLLIWCGERALSEKPPHGSRGSSAVLGGESSSGRGV